MTTSDQLKESLRQIFDAQIPNFGDYNLVFASNASAIAPSIGAARTDDPTSSGRPQQLRCYVVGYRWQPAEIVVAPFNADTLTAGSVAEAINMTNLHHAMKLPGGDIEIGTTTGKSFRFGVRPDGALPDLGGQRRGIEQADDCEDFATFIDAFLAKV
ncbi:MAG TPA: hypothetical protein VGN49_04730 [Micrococcaceae bacterium]|nr:hypothetical protein [Micrococcaceae bacterium]